MRGVELLVLFDELNFGEMSLRGASDLLFWPQNHHFCKPLRDRDFWAKSGINR